ncbi:MAG: hypothetical protein HC908_00880 [Calothrix sp. SM1_7_51]|nr:hypothetical protein [Calothrix sp. SM1_7_51]
MIISCQSKSFAKKQIEQALSEQKLTGLLVSEFLMKQGDIREENIEGLVQAIRRTSV